MNEWRDGWSEWNGMECNGMDCNEMKCNIVEWTNNNDEWMLAWMNAWKKGRKKWLKE